MIPRFSPLSDDDLPEVRAHFEQADSAPEEPICMWCETPIYVDQASTQGTDEQGEPVYMHLECYADMEAASHTGTE